jgi:hypothetical protein
LREGVAGMVKSKIYIATSERAKLIAEKLRDELRTAGYCTDTWADAVNNYPGQSRFGVLQHLVKEYDFALIIFAKADVLIADVHNARDSSIFEAGFFMAAFRPERCILVSSVEKKELPEVLEGIILYKFVEPNDLTNRMEVDKAIQTVTSNIKDRLYRIDKENIWRDAGTGRLSPEELLARETLIRDEGELSEDQVVVASIQPREREYNLADRVRKNLDYGIKYVYFIHGNSDTAFKIPRMLQLLLLAKLLKPEQEGDFSVRRELVKANLNIIISDLKQMCNNDQLNIYFLSEPPDIEYCIFNATDKDSAKMYVKHRDEYIEWESGDGAHQFWEKLKERTFADNPTPRLPLFHAVDPFKLDKEPFFSRLRRETLNMFPEIGEQVIDICLKGPT